MFATFTKPDGNRVTLHADRIIGFVADGASPTKLITAAGEIVISGSEAVTRRTIEAATRPKVSTWPRVILTLS